MAARICPRCSTRVDERRAKASPFCLSCGAPLGPVEASATFAGKPASSGSALPWILGGVALLIVLGVGGTIAVLVLASSATPDPPPAASATAVGAAGAPGPAGAPQLPKLEDGGVASADAGLDAGKTAAPPPTKLGAVPPPKPNEPPVCVTARDARARGSPAATVLEDQCRAALGFTPPPPRPTTTTTSTVGTATADPGTLPPFPRARAQAEVDRVASTVNAACQRPEGPFGVGSIRVDFEPDGRTGTLSRPPFASGPVGSCISSRFLAIKIGKFDGSRTSIEKSFIIQQ